MEFNGTTFVLEIINFLVLMWLLHYFFFKPVKDVIIKRKEHIDQSLADVQGEQSRIEQLKQQYENRVNEWETEKSQYREQLHRVIDNERKRLMDLLHQELDDERQKFRNLEAKRNTEIRLNLEKEAAVDGARFLTQLLMRLATPEIEACIVDMVIEDLREMPKHDLQSLQEACRPEEESVKVFSRYPIDAARRQHMNTALSEAVGQTVACEFMELPDLVAGIRISIGPWIVRASLRDELKFFEENYHASRANNE